MLTEGFFPGDILYQTGLSPKEKNNFLAIFPTIVVAQSPIPVVCLKNTLSKTSSSVGKLVCPLEKQD